MQGICTVLDRIWSESSNPKRASPPLRASSRRKSWYYPPQYLYHTRFHASSTLSCTTPRRLRRLIPPRAGPLSEAMTLTGHKKPCTFMHPAKHTSHGDLIIANSMSRFNETPLNTIAGYMHAIVVGRIGKVKERWESWPMTDTGKAYL